MLAQNLLINNRYRPETLLKEGPYVQVYLATDQATNRPVVIKMLLTTGLDVTNLTGQFKKEMKAVATLSHPNILPLLDYNLEEKNPYIVTPWMEYGTIADRMEPDTWLPVETAIKFIEQGAAALDYAHRRNILHCNVKPHNLFVTGENEQIQLADFGVSRILNAAFAPGSSTIFGTPAYMAPEQFEGQTSIRVDLYALGCIAFRLLTGRLPFTGPSAQVVSGHLSGKLPSLEAVSNGRLPASLQPVFERVLAKKPQERYFTARAFAAELRAIFPKEKAASPPVQQQARSTKLSPLPEKIQSLGLETLGENDWANTPIALDLSSLTSDYYEAVKAQRFELAALEGVNQASLQLEISTKDVISTGLKSTGSDHLYFWKNASSQGAASASLVAPGPQAIRLISREHAHFVLKDGAITLFSGSYNGTQAASNGTFVNGERLEFGQGKALEDGDLIGFGPRGKGPNKDYSRVGGVTLVFKRLDN